MVTHCLLSGCEKRPSSLSLLLFPIPALGNMLDLLHPSPLVKQLTSHRVFLQFLVRGWEIVS